MVGPASCGPDAPEAVPEGVRHGCWALPYWGGRLGWYDPMVRAIADPGLTGVPQSPPHPRCAREPTVPERTVRPSAAPVVRPSTTETP